MKVEVQVEVTNLFTCGQQSKSVESVIDILVYSLHLFPAVVQFTSTLEKLTHCLASDIYVIAHLLINDNFLVAM